jgi:protein disulfide-isomerase A1
MKNAKYMFLGLAVILAILFLVRYHFYSKEAGFEGTNSFTLYYAEWCPHCKAVKPVFEGWSKAGSVTVNGTPVFLNIVEADANPEQVSANGVKGFPTMLFQGADGSRVEYSGERTPSAWESWLKSQLK